MEKQQQVIQEIDNTIKAIEKEITTRKKNLTYNEGIDPNNSANSFEKWGNIFIGLLGQIRLFLVQDNQTRAKPKKAPAKAKSTTKEEPKP